MLITLSCLLSSSGRNCGQMRFCLLYPAIVDSFRCINGVWMLENLVGFLMVVDDPLDSPSRASMEQCMMGVPTNRTRRVTRTFRQLMTAFQAFKTEAKFHDGRNFLLH